MALGMVWYGAKYSHGMLEQFAHHSENFKKPEKRILQVGGLKDCPPRPVVVRLRPDWAPTGAARKGDILSQRDGSDGACRRFRSRNGFAKADQIKTKSRQNLTKDEI